MKISDLTWQSFKRFLPTTIDQLGTSQKGDSLAAMTVESLLTSESSVVIRWHALLMESVYGRTTGAAFPASLYSDSGQGNAANQWNDESRHDLVMDVWISLLGVGGNDTLHNGNQLLYIVKHASYVAQAKKMIKTHTIRVLRQRFKSQAMGHLTELLIDVLKDEFIVIPPPSRSFQDKFFAIKQESIALTEESHEHRNVAIREFKMMRRNKVSWGVTESGKDQTFPRLYDKREIKKAVDRIIEHLGHGVRMRFLRDGMQLALSHLDASYGEIVDQGKDDENSSEPDFIEVSRGIVDKENLRNLLPGEVNRQSTQELQAEGGTELQQTVMEIKSRISGRQLKVLAYVTRGMTNDATATHLNISPETVSRELRDARSKITTLIEEHTTPETDGRQTISKAMEVLLGSYGAGDHDD